MYLLVKQTMALYT